MRNTNTIFVLILMFVLALGAGAVAGKLTSRLPAPPAVSPAQQATLVEQLQLTPQQRDQMQAIWEGVRDTAREKYQRAQNVQSQFEEQVKAMLSPEQQKRYALLSKKAHDDIAQLDVERRAALQTAIEKTKAMLNDQQRKAYEQIIQARLGALSTTEAGM